MNIYDISEKSGVSIATVSRVLNGSAHVSEKTRQKVLAVMEEEGYQPNAFARGLGLNTMKVIGILYSDSSDTFLSSAIYHLERNFRSHGYDSLLCCTGYILEDRQKYTQWILSKRVDALVLVGSHFVEENEDDNAYIRTAASQVPVAILGARLAGENIYCSLCDDYLSSIHLAESLFQRGSEQIAFLYHVVSDSVRKKLAGLREAYRRKGMVFREKNALLCPSHDIDACVDFLRAMNRQLSFDTIMCMDDQLAVGALKYAQAEQIAVPSDLQIAGYNNSVLARCSTPELTTVDNHLEELCEAVVQMIIARLIGLPAENLYTVQGTIVYRDTTLPKEEL